MEELELDGGGATAGSSRANRFVARLVWLYGGFTIFAVAGLGVGLLPFAALNAWRTQSLEAIGGGLAGLTLSTLLMALTGLCAALALTAARQRRALSANLDLPASARFAFLREFGPGVAARQGQALVVTLGAVLTCLASWALWPAMALMPVARTDPNLLGAVVIGIAFCSLIGERMMAAFPAPLLPEAPGLRRILLVTTLLLAAAGALEICRGANVPWIYWFVCALSVLPWIVVIELALRALARLFLPAPKAAEARAVSDSMFLGLLTGGARAPGALIKEHLGLDFTRSWALSYLASAAMPAILATALLCWALSGLKLIDISHRGIYERFGAPVAVLGPGIHLLLPWPIGVMRPVEFGTLHEIKVGSREAAAAEPHIAAEAIPPASSNHLWDTADPTEAEYLVASQSGAVQGFQAVDAEIHVVYRTGLTDEAAMQSVYGVAGDPGILVGESASRVISNYFASNTLEAVMGAKRDALAESLRQAVARDIATYHAGIEIVSLHIESVHPPAGAAAAYHAVQAAEINATASIYNETGRAKRVAAVADQEAHQLVTSAQATADEKIEDAKGIAVQFTADHKAYLLEPNSFLMERTFSSLVTTLNQVRLTVIDHRLTPAQIPVIDLRGNTPPPAPFQPPPPQTETPLEATTPATSNTTAPLPAATPAPAPAASGTPMPLTPGIESEQ
jgi:regulator of protease activity HflC (stomatin/prohibitin superfamily)